MLQSQRFDDRKSIPQPSDIAQILVLYLERSYGFQLTNELEMIILGPIADKQ